MLFRSTTATGLTETSITIELSSGDYPDNISAVFEAGLSVVSGEAWARLKNKTSGVIMAVTEISNNTQTVVWKTSI